MLRVNEYAAIVAQFFAVKDKRGVTAIEYGLIAALIAVAIIVGARAVGSNLNALFNSVATTISS
ncbi:Flp family type IVb pilin [Acetobacter fabarum]|uniref:Flp family type IVb pilin n=1 Tax=Acetobacter fabarum TaxID=483199 RepID=UPI00312BA27F